MARRKGKKKTPGDAATPPAKPAPHVGASFADLLKGFPLEASAPEPAAPAGAKTRPEPTPPKAPRPSPPKISERPSETLRGDDRVAYYEAIRGVRPIGGAPRATGQPKVTPAQRRSERARASAVDAEARRRLEALVSGSVRLEVEHHDEVVLAVRPGTPRKVAEALRRSGVAPEASLDLHGFLGDEAVRELGRFLRKQASRGVRRCLVVHGKGLHSEGGVPVLRDRVVEALTEGSSASWVRAFATAPAALGGEGALMVELAR